MQAERVGPISDAADAIKLLLAQTRLRNPERANSNLTHIADTLGPKGFHDLLPPLSREPTRYLGRPDGAGGGEYVGCEAGGGGGGV